MDLYGSLAKTGRGHMTDMAVMLGLSNEDPVTCDTAAIPATIEAIRRSRTLMLGGQRPVRFDPATDCRFNSLISLPQHPNGMTFTALLADGSAPRRRTIPSGAASSFEEGESDEGAAAVTLPFPIESARELLGHCSATG